MTEPSISLRIIDTLMRANAGNRGRLVDLRSIRARTLACQRLDYPREIAIDRTRIGDEE